jgi:hypothetical protein
VDSEVYNWGELQAVHAPPSSWHWKVEPVVDDVNVKRALVAAVAPWGSEVIEVVGGVVSIVNVLAAVYAVPAEPTCWA